jgi:rubrerythrin
MSTLWFDLEGTEQEEPDDLVDTFPAYRKTVLLPEDENCNDYYDELLSDEEDDIICPQCGEIIEDGIQCPVCGFMVEL